MPLDMDSIAAHEAILIQQGSFLGVAAFFAQTWDWATLLLDEVEYIWVGKLTLMKTVYAVARYGVLVGQLLFWVTLVLEYSGYLVMNNVLYQAPTCTTPTMPDTGLALFVTGTSFCQIFVFALTSIKLLRCHNTGMTPLASLMLNEGAGIFSLLVGLSIPLSVFGLLGTVGTTWQEAAFSWYLSLLSIIACRLIIQLRKLAINARRRCDHDEIEEELQRLDPALT
ncbi:hypothetical protein BJ165DRAFT_1399964 [Panaeolus papilionaceus]|nr:hypothetical protein BJ165DRAFT_1399964 [Panaeolus papilionaceus]